MQFPHFYQDISLSHPDLHRDSPHLTVFCHCCVIPRMCFTLHPCAKRPSVGMES